MGKGELTCKRGRRNQNWTHMPLSPLFSNFSFEFSSWPCVAKLLYLVEGNGSLEINKIVRSNLFLLSREKQGKERNQNKRIERIK